MAKRSDGQFERIPNDLYRTWDTRALARLLPHLSPQTLFVEPCAGAGDLVDQLVNAGHRCRGAFDIAPLRGDIRPGDATTLRWNTSTGVWITNPPWTRHMLHAIIRNLAAQAPMWALFDADWMHIDKSAQLMPICRKIVSVGRLKFIPDSEHDGKDNCAWYLFDATRPPGPIEFVGRS